MSLAFQHVFSEMVILLFSFGMQDYDFGHFWSNTESNSTSEGQGETKQNNCEGQTVSLAIQHGFSKVVLLFFFLLLCEILSPVCPPKIFFKNLHIDTQYFIQQKHRLRGQINILHRQITKWKQNHKKRKYKVVKWVKSVTSKHYSIFFFHSYFLLL